MKVCLTERIVVLSRWATAAIMLVCWAGCSRSPSPAESAVAEPPVVPLDRLDRTQVQVIEQARTRVVSEPQSAEAWGSFGQALDAVDYHQAAQTCYAQAAALDPQSVRWFYLLGWLQLQDHPEAGLANLRRAVELADVEPDIPRLRLAQALIERGQWAAARPHLERLLQVSPWHPAARLELGRILLAEQSLDRAVETLTPCLTNAYTARPALLILAQVRQRQGQADLAAAMAKRAAGMPRQFDWPDPYLREVLRLRVDRQKLSDHINGLLMSGRLTDAEEGLRKLLGAFPADAEGLLLLGRLRFLERKCDEAETVLRQHLEVQPASLNGLIQLALALLCQQRWTDAESVLRQAIDLKHDFAEAHFNLGYVLARKGDQAGAIDAYEDALRCNPGDVKIHVTLAEELFRSGDAAAAREHLDRALALDPGDEKARQLRDQLPAVEP